MTLYPGFYPTPFLPQKLTAPDAAFSDEFCRYVSISGDTALVGAFFDDDASSSSGSVYLFENIPEPSSLLFAIHAGLFGLGTRRRRRR